MIGEWLPACRAWPQCTLVSPSAAIDPSSPARSSSRALRLDVVAEGIERPDQARRLRELGCRLGQGYLFARPLAPDMMETFLAQPEGSRRARRRAARPSTPGRIKQRRLRLVSGA